MEKEKFDNYRFSMGKSLLAGSNPAGGRLKPYTMMFPPSVKHVSVVTKEPWCSVCESFLKGDGSVITPRKCKCGTYEYSYSERNYQLKPKSNEAAD
jgi:hypothetical protein